MELFEALPEDDPLTAAVEGVPFKRLYMFQDGHASPGAANWQPLLDRFFAHTLQGADNGVDTEPEVLTEGRSRRRREHRLSQRAELAAAGDRGQRRCSWAAARTGGELAARPARAAPGGPLHRHRDPDRGGLEARARRGGELALLRARRRWRADARMAGEALLRATISVEPRPRPPDPGPRRRRSRRRSRAPSRGASSTCSTATASAASSRSRSASRSRRPSPSSPRTRPSRPATGSGSSCRARTPPGRSPTIRAPRSRFTTARRPARASRLTLPLVRPASAPDLFD